MNTPVEVRTPFLSRAGEKALLTPSLAVLPPSSESCRSTSTRTPTQPTPSDREC